MLDSFTTVHTAPEAGTRHPRHETERHCLVVVEVAVLVAIVESLDNHLGYRDVTDCFLTGVADVNKNDMQP